MKILLNDTIISADSPTLHCNDRGFLLGDGIFETIRAEQKTLLFFSQHYERLKSSAKILHLILPINLEDLQKKCVNLLQLNNLNGTASVRITLTRGRAERGIHTQEGAPPTLLITTAPYTAQPDKTVTAFITSIKRNEYSPFTTLKTINYLDSIMARQEAIQHGFDEGIMLNTEGVVTETSIANLFAVIGEQVVTPKISDGALPGITRKLILNIANKAGIPMIEETLLPQDLFQATEIFQTNSLIEIQSLSAVNDHKLKIHTSAVITERIKRHYFSLKNACTPFS